MTGNETRKPKKLRVYERRDKREFLSLLKQAWTVKDRHFSENEQSCYQKWLNYLQFAEETVRLDHLETRVLYEYIHKTVLAYLTHSIQVKDVEKGVLEEFQNIYFMIEYFLMEHQGKTTEKGLTKLLYLILEIKQYSSEELEFLMEFYEKSELLYKVCYYLYYHFDYICEEQVIYTFLSHIRHTKTYKLFSMFLYQINPIFFKQAEQIPMADCGPRELFYGICCGYFTYREGNEAHSRLLELCKLYEMDLKVSATADHPLFGLFMLYQYGYLKSLEDYGDLLKDTDFYKLLYFPMEINYKEMPIKWLEIINTKKCLKNVITCGGMEFYCRVAQEIKKHPHLASKEIYRRLLRSKDQMI